MAQWFAEHGITAAVLKYRMPNGHPEVPLEDVEQALRIMMGTRSGSHGLHGGQGRHRGQLGRRSSRRLGFDARPHQTRLLDPLLPGHHGRKRARRTKGSFNALLGDKRSAETDTWYSLQNRVSSETPPTLLLLSDDDRVVPPVNSTLYYNALKDNGVKASMHIYPDGRATAGASARISNTGSSGSRPCSTGCRESTNSRCTTGNSKGRDL